jgi:menaquinone-9 beta-reductase
MQITSMHDVVIVGGGPAGATAAYLLKLQGLDVVVVDKSTFPREKLCGGLLTYKTLRLLYRIYGDTLKTLQEKHIIEYISNAFEIRIEDKLFSSDIADPPFVLVDRYIYDNYLLERAKEVGVNVIEGDSVKHVDPSKQQVLTSSGKILQTRFILGADGVNSIVRKALPETKFKQNSWKDNLAAGLEVFIPRSDINTSFECPVVYFGLVNWGYAWVFPNKERVVVGVGALARHNKSMRDSLETILSLIGYKKAPLPQPLGHPVPYGNFLSSPAYGSILLLGDSAGLVDPFIGEGIYYAQRSAEIASKCIQEAMSEGTCIEVAYPRYLRESILKELAIIKRTRWLLFGMASNLHYVPLKVFLRILGPRRGIELVQGIRSYQWYRKRDKIDGELSL